LVQSSQTRHSPVTLAHFAMGNCQGKGVDAKEMIVDGTVNMDQKMPNGGDIKENPVAAATKDHAVQEEEKEVDADEVLAVDETHEETEQKEVDETDKHNASVDVITESVKRIDIQHDEVKHEEPGATSQVETMETEYQPQVVKELQKHEAKAIVEPGADVPEMAVEVEAHPEPEIEETVTEEVLTEDIEKAEASDMADMADKPQLEEDEVQPEIKEATEAVQEQIEQQSEEPMLEDAVEVVVPVAEPVTVDEEPVKVAEQEVLEDVDVEANEEASPVIETQQDRDSVDLDEAETDTVAYNAEQEMPDVDDQEMVEPKDALPVSPDANNAEEMQTAPAEETAAEPGTEDDELIIKTVLSFVNPDEVDMRFDTATHGGSLQFADARTVSKINDDAPSICVFGQPISAESHEQCDIEVQWKASASEEGGFYMGYLTKRKEEIRCWNAELGSILCLDSVGYYVYGGCGYFRELREGNCHEIGYRAPTNLKAGDTMRMIVDFTKDTVTLRHNGKMAAICPLYGHKEITWAFSFGPQGEEIEVLSCEMK